MLPRISPPGNCVEWKLMYARPSRRLASCASSVVFCPSGASHLALTSAPTPTENGVTRESFGLLSLKGVPMKPQTTGPLVLGVTFGPAWMCALVRLSLASFGDCEPV